MKDLEIVEIKDIPKLPTLTCQQCGYGKDPRHPWIPRTTDPKECPQCKSRKWNIPKKKA